MVAFAEEAVLRGDFCQGCWDKGGPELELAPPVVGESEPDAEQAEGAETPQVESESEAPADEACEPVESETAAGAESEGGETTDGKPHRFWWTTHHQAKPQKTLQMDMDALQRLFLELTDRKETNLRELRYVLCLLLMRKKRVKLERILRDDSGESFIVRRPKLDERYTVEVFDFTPERMAEVREHLQAIFDGVDDDESLAQAAAGEEVDSPGAEELAEPVTE